MHLRIPTSDRMPEGFLPQRLVLERILYDAEMPIVYTTRTPQGQQLLAYVADESELGTFTIVAPLSERTLAALESGAMSVRDALTSSCAWLHVRGQNVGAWAVDLEHLPVGFLPMPGTPLLSDQEPVLRTRAIGEKVVLGQIPASVVAFVADSTRKAVKTLLDFYLTAPSGGRPPEEHRALYDLPVRSFAFASFELGFGPPEATLFGPDQMRTIIGHLYRGLCWASSVNVEPDHLVRRA